jgi:hypothetical protein
VEYAKGELRLRVGLPASCRFVLFSPMIVGKEAGIKPRRGEGKEMVPETHIEMVNI